MANHNNVLKIAQELKDKSIEARAYAGLGHAARCTGDIVQAKMWHEKQLDMALNTKDKVAEGRACSNLGMYLKFVYYEKATWFEETSLLVFFNVNLY